MTILDCHLCGTFILIVSTLISCKDDQTSADAQEAGKSTGAMSYAFTSKEIK